MHTEMDIGGEGGPAKSQVTPKIFENPRTPWPPWSIEKQARVGESESTKQGAHCHTIPSQMSDFLQNKYNISTKKHKIFIFPRISWQLKSLYSGSLRPTSNWRVSFPSCMWGLLRWLMVRGLKPTGSTILIIPARCPRSTIPWCVSYRFFLSFV